MDAFEKEFPNRFFQTGISEANMMGMAALNNTLNGVNSFQLPIVYSTEFGRADGFFNNNQFPRMFGNIDNDIYPDLKCYLRQPKPYLFQTQRYRFFHLH